MSAGDVILGGGITLVGTVVTQWAVLQVAGSTRREARKVAAAQYERDSLERVQEAAKTYRTALVAYNSELVATGSTSSTEQALKQARMDYQALVHRVDPAVVQRLASWEPVAVNWSGGIGSAAAEEVAWNDAMTTCGAAMRATFR